ncbi:hypothetical protein [Haloterrigena salifodinae]|uniref:hypothetical protein n=1 Tax=Haloterrigena salifodinae TaxID=2675099 RepID=UPI000F8698F4|nr:hypothetical protein [Haloterrigena salifodinae]
MCDQVALYLVEETGNDLTEAEVTIPHDSVEWSVIDAIDPEQLPTERPTQVREIETRVSEATPRLASRRSVGETVQESTTERSATGGGSNPGLEAVDDHHEQLRFSVEDVNAAASRVPTI